MWRDIASIQDVGLNQARSFKVGEQRVLLVRSATGLYCLEDKCPHQEQTMADGAVDAKGVECPWHSVKVELASGKIINDMGFLGMPSVKVFPVKEENQRIFADLP